MPAGAALVFRETLLFLALGTAAIHLALTQIIFEKESAAWTIFSVRPGDLRFAAGERALKDGLTI
jgi:hypothetical protein